MKTFKPILILLLASLIAGPALALDTIFVIDENGAKPRCHFVGVDTTSAGSQCVSAFKITIIGPRAVGSNYVIPHTLGQVAIGYLVKNGVPRFCLVRNPRDGSKKTIIGDAQNLKKITLSEGVKVVGTKFHGNWSAPGGKSAHMEIDKTVHHPTFEGTLVERGTIAKVIETLEQNAGAPGAGPKSNLRVLRKLAKCWAKWDSR